MKNIRFLLFLTPLLFCSLFCDEGFEWCDLNHYVKNTTDEDIYISCHTKSMVMVKPNDSTMISSIGHSSKVRTDFLLLYFDIELYNKDKVLIRNWSMTEETGDETRQARNIEEWRLYDEGSTVKWVFDVLSEDLVPVDNQ